MKSGSVKDDENSKTNYCEDIQIQIKSDSLFWHMPPTDVQHSDYDGFSLSFDRTLANGVDEIMVTGADGFPVKTQAFQE